MNHIETLVKIRYPESLKSTGLLKTVSAGEDSILYYVPTGVNRIK